MFRVRPAKPAIGPQPAQVYIVVADDDAFARRLLLEKIGTHLDAATGPGFCLPWGADARFKDVDGDVFAVTLV